MILRALWAKEWRDHRWLIIGFLLLTPLLSLGLKLGIRGWEKTSPEDTMCLFLPGMLLLFVVAIAADLVAAEAGSGRMAFYAALPVRPSAVWGAKFVFLAVASFLFFGYVLLAEVAILEIGGKDPAYLMVYDSMRWTWLFVPIVVAGAATLMFSTLIDRGLAAVLAAGVALGVITGLGWLVRQGGLDLRPGQDGFLPGCGLATMAFLAGSFAAVTFGRIHLGARRRRVGLAACGFLLVALPTSTWAGVRVHQWLHIEPHHDDYEISSVYVEPSGEWAFVHAERPKVTVPKRVRQPRAVWAIRLDDGRLVDLSRYGEGVQQFLKSETGIGAVIMGREKKPRTGRRITELTQVDLKTGEAHRIEELPPSPWEFACWGRLKGLRIVSVGSGDQSHRRIILPDGRTKDLEPGWTRGGPEAQWGMQLYRHERTLASRQVYAWLDFDSLSITPLESRLTLISKERSDGAWSFRTVGNREDSIWQLDRISLADGHAETVIPAQPIKVLVDHLHSWRLLQDEGGLIRLDANLSAPVRIAELDLDLDSIQVRTNRYCALEEVAYVTDGKKAWLITRTDQKPKVERMPVADVPEWPTWFDGRRWLRKGKTKGSLWLGGIGQEERRLLPTERGADPFSGDTGS